MDIRYIDGDDLAAISRATALFFAHSADAKNVILLLLKIRTRQTPVGRNLFTLPRRRWGPFRVHNGGRLKERGRQVTRYTTAGNKSATD